MEQPLSLSSEIIMLHNMCLDDLDMQTPKVPPSPTFLARAPPSPTQTSPPPMNVDSPFSRPLVLLCTSPHRYTVAPVNCDHRVVLNLNDDDSEENIPTMIKSTGITTITPDLWQRNKKKIEDLYITKNLNLAEVISIMEQQHGFKATPRMYKRRFEQWGWCKYNAKRRQQAIAAGKPVLQRIGKTCSRRNRAHAVSSLSSTRALRQLQPYRIVPLIHANETARILDTALSCLYQYITGCAESDPEWKSTDELNDLLHNSQGYTSITMALDLFDDGDNTAGGRLLRRACKYLEEEMLKHALSFVSVCTQLLDDFLDFYDPSPGVLVFTSVLRIAESNTVVQCIVPILQTFLQILKQEPQEASYMLTRFAQMWLDRFRDLRGLNDTSTLVVLQDIINMQSVECDQFLDKEVRIAGVAYEQLLELANSRHGTHSLSAHCIEDEVLQFHWVTDVFGEDFATRNETILEAVIERFLLPQHLTKTRLQNYRIMISRCYLRLFDFYSREDNAAKMSEIARDYVNRARHYVHKLDWVEDLFWMERRLREAGMDEEAESMRMERLHSRLYIDLESEFADEEAEFLATRDWYFKGSSEEAITTAAA